MISSCSPCAPVQGVNKNNLLGGQFLIVLPKKLKIIKGTTSKLNCQLTGGWVLKSSLTGQAALNISEVFILNNVFVYQI